MSDYPVVLSAVTDNVDDAMAKYINNLENKVGITNSADTDSIDYLLKNQERGKLINGKIVVSVASNNLTVAIKGKDGNDPSATNPVYCLIGDTVRSITAAKSRTINAGTNWFDLGAAETAAKEQDIFVYLGYYSAVQLLVSRTPYATLDEDFGGSDVGDHHAVGYGDLIGDSTVECIGRFAATLSAGAGYTWSVPTFTDKNLIQRPIRETRWLDCTPTLTWTAGTPPSGSPTTMFRYKLVGDICYVNYVGYGYTAGATVTGLTATIAMTRLLGIVGASSGHIGVANAPNPTECTINYALAGFELYCTSSSATAFWLSGFYGI